MKNRNLDHKDTWATPKEFYDKLNEKWNFTFDPCPLTHEEITPENDGLLIEWGTCNFVNPPYSRKLKEAFIMKAIEESKKGKRCVMLLPVSTSTKIFHEHILPNATKIEFVKGRIKFEGIDSKGNKSKGAGMHDSMIVIFGDAR
jgi:phage N-6-adenine-methyltransferase